MPSITDDRLRSGLAVLSVLVVLYSLLIAQQILLGLLAVATIWGVYLFYHLILVLARIASALEQLVQARTDGGRDAPEGEQSALTESATETDIESESESGSDR